MTNQASHQPDRTPGSEDFGGVIGRTRNESEPWWPSPPDLAGKPNVVLILFDDTGFAHFGCFGSTIATPNIDRLAAGGLRYTNFHTTALCSPTRAALLTGRNHHTVGMRCISNFDTGFPHMRGRISHNAATLAELLSDAGYATHAIGKWHLCPMTEASPAGPHHDWPLGRGFDRFYGFLQGETDQFHPELTYDNHAIDPPARSGPPGEDGYHLSEDLTDHAIQFIRESTSIRPDRPFFTYLAWGATHSPHQAPQAYLDKYRGAFDDGWDEARAAWFERQLDMGIVPPGTNLAPRNRGVRAWEELSPAERAVAARLQEAFAAFLDHTDAQIGRLVDFLEATGQLDDTLLIVTSDNGASQEGFATGVIDEMRFFNGYPEEPADRLLDRLDDVGGPHSHTNYPWGWAQAGNTPLKWYKQNTHGGGVRDPLVIHWPNRITDAGGIRHQFHHVVDLAPTILESVGVEQPDLFRGREQLPVAGTSLSASFDDPGADTDRGPQYFEMFGHRGIVADGWKAVTLHRRGTPFDEDTWELYHLDEDFSETNDLAEAEPEKLAEMIELWWAEAERHGVLPLDDDVSGLAFRDRRPGTPHATNRYRFLPPIDRLSTEAAPALGGRSWVMRADIERPTGTEEGVLVAFGTSNTGFTWYAQDGEAVFDYNLFGTHHVARAPLPPGGERTTIEATLVRHQNGGELTVTTDAGSSGPVHLPFVLRFVAMSGMDVGRDGGSPITDAYEAPFPFAGPFHELTIEITDDLDPHEIIKQDAERIRRELAQQ
jgi:arylsulfatase A-like enzyme